MGKGGVVGVGKGEWWKSQGCVGVGVVGVGIG